jgi:hypothetical protein
MVTVGGNNDDNNVDDDDDDDCLSFARNLHLVSLFDLHKKHI